MPQQNIFLGEDIRRQLPGESSDFDDINNSWKYITNRLNDTRNALRGTTEKGTLTWTLMNVGTGDIDMVPTQLIEQTEAKWKTQKN